LGYTFEISRNVFNSGHKLECNIEYSVRKFYTAANTIYSRSKFASEISKLFLLETFCLPLISYGCECANYDCRQLCQLNVCWNNAYRKVFGMHAWQSVKELQIMCERLDFRHICTLKKFLFLHKVARFDNAVLKMCYLFYCHSAAFVSMCHEFDIALDVCTITDIRRKVSAHFSWVVLNRM